MKAKQIIEEVFDTVLSSKHPYHTQVNDLDVSGDLGSRKKLATVMFRLAQFVDEMENRLAVLEARFAPIEVPMTDGFAQVTPPPETPVVPEPPAQPTPEPIAEPAPIPDVEPVPDPANIQPAFIIPDALPDAQTPPVDEATDPARSNPDQTVQS